METIDELQAFLTSASQEGVRGRLLARGEARAVIRRDGVLPEGAPPFAAGIDTDLCEYGFSLLRAALALREAGGDSASWRQGFQRAASAFEALVRNGDRTAVDQGFFRVIGAAAYHLAGYSAMGYSLLGSRGDSNFAPAEQALAYLILRDLDNLRDHVRGWLLDESHTDPVIAENLARGTVERDDIIATILTISLIRGLAFFDFALVTGDHELHRQSVEILKSSQVLAADAGAVSLWWIARISRNLVDDLWASSLHVNLPPDPPPGGESYPDLRPLFLASLYRRKTSEIELWPSQIDAAKRVADLSDDLVVSLPTSAGKTRIAELSTLMTLSTGRRVLIVTPLRALSAQTERSFRRTFGPLGFRVSSLYGSSGTSPSDSYALHSHNIVIATPEKADFALRSDPSILNDIGLIVLDEGHLIGPNDREIRYEVLVQRLLRRSDADSRRIVCLSAILPDGDQLRDLSSWIRSDAEGEAVKCPWRPTRQRFGILAWLQRQRGGRLILGLDNEAPFIPRFIEERPPIAPQRKPFPRDTRQLTLAASWAFASDGQRVLIFCTQRDHVEGYAGAIVDLIDRGYLESLAAEDEQVGRALAVGREWLGDRHPAVKCLEHGVAIHHARLPRPFLRELEALLAAGILRITVASPTLAQGLNLNASVLLVPTIHRAGERLTAEEFANVAGRAGRAYVDLEGLVVHVMHDLQDWRVRAWRDLVLEASARNLQSGLLQVIAAIAHRLSSDGVLDGDDAFEYLANAREAWQAEEKDVDDEPLASLVERLDAAIFGLLEAYDTDPEQLPELLDQALTGSLWARQLQRLSADQQQLQQRLLLSRTRLIWNHSSPQQRRGHFAMGVGLDVGLSIDQMGAELDQELERADVAAISGDIETLTLALIAIAERMFSFGPFAPHADLPGDWRDLLKGWISGADVTQRGPNAMTVIDEAFVYRLVWAVEAIRVRKNLTTSSDIVEGGATAALETGVPLMTMAMLIRAGLPSRKAAIGAVEATSAGFLEGREMMDWIRSTEIEQLTASGAWPTPDTASIWREFRAGLLTGTDGKWTRTTRAIGFDQDSIISQPEHDRPYRVDWDEASSSYWVCEPDFRRVAKLENAPGWWASAVVYCIYSGQESEFLVTVTGLADE